MASYTLNLNLELPSVEDFISPVPFNNNFEAVDREIAALILYKSKVDKIENDLGDINTILNEINGEDV